jgi:hypothetical protein
VCVCVVCVCVCVCVCVVCVCVFVCVYRTDGRTRYAGGTSQHLSCDLRPPSEKKKSCRRRPDALRRLEPLRTATLRKSLWHSGFAAFSETHKCDTPSGREVLCASLFLSKGSFLPAKYIHSTSFAGALSQSVAWVATELRAGRSGIESRWRLDFPPVQTGTGAHPSSCKMGTVFSWGQSAAGACC